VFQTLLIVIENETVVLMENDFDRNIMETLTLQQYPSPRGF